jgi:NhaP-type Na+/H+ or K+/H+ antiporter
LHENREHADGGGRDEVVSLRKLRQRLLFLLIALQVFAISTRRRALLIGLVAIPISLIARWVSVAVPVVTIKRAAGTSPSFPLPLERRSTAEATR